MPRHPRWRRAASGIGQREQQVDEALGRRLRLVIGEARPLVRLDEDVVGSAGDGTMRSMPTTGMLDGPRRRDRGLDQGRMDVVGDVVDRAAGVQVGGLAHLDLDAVRRHVVEPEAGVGEAALGLGIERDAALAAGRRRAPAALALDQVAHGGLAVADDVRGPADRGGDHPVVDHDEAQVLALGAGLDQHPIAELPRRGHGLAIGLDGRRGRPRRRGPARRAPA